MKNQELKRISLMLKADQYSELVSKNINLSGLVRDLIDDHLSDFKITLSVTKETHDLYSLIVSNTGSSDDDIEKYLKDALKALLSDRIREMQKLEKDLNSQD